MLKRYEYELMNRLERVRTVGSTEILREELKLWYKMDRLGVSVWRDIQDRWEGITEDPDLTLLLAQGDGVFVFIWGEGLTVTDKSWFKDVRNWARRAPTAVEEAEEV